MPKNIASNDYIAAIIDKHNRLNNINGPKIIFSGGSNLAYGLDSKMLEEEFAVPVVNLGLHAGLGLNFILTELKNTVKNGDVVFLSIEYFLDSEGSYGLKKLCSKYYNEAFKYYNFNLIEEISYEIYKTRNNIKSYEKDQKSSDMKFKKSTNNLKREIQIYSREAFNSHGDIIAHLDLKLPIFANVNKGPADDNVWPYRIWNGVNELNEFFDFAKSKNVKVYFLYPVLRATEFNRNQAALLKLSGDISNNLNMEILNKPIDLVFNDSLFFDSPYHLNRKGRELRTKRVIEFIKKNPNSNQRLISMRVKQKI
jgi:hypothetical protein